MRKTLLTFIDDFATDGDDLALAHKTGLRTVRWTRREVAANACRLARELEARGIGKGDRVLFWANNSPAWVAAFLGCLLRGVIVVPLDAPSTPGFVDRVRLQTEPKLLFYGGEAGREFAADLQRLSPRPSLDTLTLDTLTAEIAHHSGAPYTAVDISEDDLVEIIYTSGTTAEPKGVCLTHRNLLANLNPLERGMQKYLRWEWLVHPLRFLSLVPLSDVLGQFMGLFVPQLLKGELIFQDSLSPAEIIETARRERISVIVTVPRLLDTLREKIERDFASQGRGDEFRHLVAKLEGEHFLKKWWAFRQIHRQFGWKFWAFVSGGAPLEADTEEFWRRLGYLIVQGYGMTETASLISFNNPFATTRGSLGKGFASQDMRLDENGEILVRGGNVSPGYWQQGVKPLTDDEGWLRTGDLGERDADGKLYFKGRKKDTIVTAAGLKIYPEDLEAELNRQPAVRDSVVIGIEGRRGAEPLAVLLLNDTRAEPEKIIEAANQQLSEYQQIRRWFVWQGADFPRTTATRKVRKRDLVEAVEAAVNAGSAKAPEQPKATAELAEIIARVSHEMPVNLDAAASLSADLKLDSLGRVELLSALEDRLQVELDETQFTQATTLGDIETMLRQASTPQASPQKLSSKVTAHRKTPDYPFAEWAFRFPATWARRLALYLLILPFARVLGRARVRGRENLRDLQGPVLLVSNHIAQLDAALILSVLPGRFRHRLAVAMRGERLREMRYPPAEIPRFKSLLWRLEYVLVTCFFNVFPLPQKSGFRRSFRFAGQAFDRGYNLLVFPEGERTESGRMNPFRRGIGVLIEGLKTTVVPVKIEGLFELKQQRRYFAPPGKITITFGEAVRYAETEDADFITRDLERRVAQLAHQSDHEQKSD